MGLRPESIRKLEDVAKIPLTAKSDIIDNYPLGMLAVPANQLYCLHASSGTTGKPIIVAYTWGLGEVG